jgi:hypothetical protein
VLLVCGMVRWCRDEATFEFIRRTYQRIDRRGAGGCWTEAGGLGCGADEGVGGRRTRGVGSWHVCGSSLRASFRRSIV